MSEEIILKELLSLVLDKEVCEIVWIKPHRNELQYDVQKDNDYTKLNLDTLCRLCKEWCYENGAHEVHSGIENNEDYVCIIDFEGSFDVLYFRQNKTELGSVIKATEWVAKENGLSK